MISISVTNLDGVVSQYRAAPELLNRAANAAVTKVTRKTERQLETEISKANDMPKRVLAVWRIKRRKRVPRGTGIVWAGYNPIKASYLGPVKQADWGASVRSFLFPGAFVARMESGHVGIFKREGSPRQMTRGRYAWGKERQPIVEQDVSIQEAHAIASREHSMIGKWFQEELAKELVWRVNK